MRLTILVDNLAHDRLRAEHGLSFLVETSSGHVLFDTGQSDAWSHNLLSLGKLASEINAVAISHGHYDHAGGVPAAFGILDGARFFAHPASFEAKYAQSGSELRYIGMPPDVISQKDMFLTNRSAVEVVPGITLSGEIPLSTVHPNPSGDRFLAGVHALHEDAFEDEQCMVVRSGDFVAVLVGCAHRSLENNVLAAMEVAGVERIDLLVGGFHLGNASDQRLKSLAAFLDEAVSGQIACCHCTGSEPYQYLKEELGRRVTQARAGTFWDI